MRTFLRAGLSLLAVVAFAAVGAHAADTTLIVGSDTYYIHTMTIGGFCQTRLMGGGGVQVTCTDGSIEVAANSVGGCADNNKAGYCAKNEPPTALDGNQLNCGDADYQMHSGTDGENNCTGSGETGSKRCEDASGENFAEASCEHGCGNSGGTGCCCEVGSPGCGSGVGCDNT